MDPSKWQGSYEFVITLQTLLWLIESAQAAQSLRDAAASLVAGHSNPNNPRPAEIPAAVGPLNESTG